MRLPVVLPQEEARRVVGALEGSYRLMGTLLDGSGLRLLECLRLRVNDVDFGLATAIAGTSANTNAVATLDDPFTNDPPTLADIEVLRAKMNEMLIALRR